MAKGKSYEFEVTVRHELTRTVTIRAASDDEAEAKAEELAGKLMGEIVTTAPDGWDCAETVEIQER